MRRSVIVVTALAVLAALVPTVGFARGPGVPSGPATAPPVAGLPDGGPPALYQSEPALPVPAGWPFPDAFPRTMGTGRLAGGASFWTDWLYDDHGASGTPVGFPVAGLTPPRGTYAYPDGPARNNGADIFRAAVGLDASSSWWRVDWSTLADPNVPIAAWALDTDGSPATGAAEWGAGTGVRSAGVDRLLVMSSRGAWLVDPARGDRTRVADVAVDRAARSFVARVSRSVLPVAGRWRVRLAAGLADAAGTVFAPVGRDRGAQPGQPAVYNVTFRALSQEPPSQNFWFDATQASALASGDVSPFFLDVRWDDLARRVATPEPLVRGYSNRWYVSAIELGQGIVRDAGNREEDLRPNFLGRVQPYAVYVPSSYDGGRPAPLTWILHSLGMTHSQYGALSPNLLRAACEDRRSICATTLGRGPDGWYFDEAELDFWQVWHALATAYRLDPERTVISGYSMGGYATFKLGLTYPHLFAAAVPLAGPPACGIKLGTTVLPAGAGRCTTEGDTAALVGNARWLPFTMMQGAVDELVPVTSAIDQANRFDAAGLRYRLEVYPEDHLVWAVQDRYSSAAAPMGDARVVRDPARVDFTWYPRLVRADLGIGPSSAYWLSGFTARDTPPGATASITAVSAARPQPSVTEVRSRGPIVGQDPPVGVFQQLTWKVGPPRPPAARVPDLDLRLRNVATVTVDLARAGFAPGAHPFVRVETDGPVHLRFRDRVVLVPSAGLHAFTL